MARRTLYTYIKQHARHGRTKAFFKLYLQKEQQLLNEGFSVRRMGSIKGSFRQHLCLVEWVNAVEGTVAYKFLELAAAVKPELLQKAEDDVSTPVPPPYSSGGWDLP